MLYNFEINLYNTSQINKFTFINRELELIFIYERLVFKERIFTQKVLVFLRLSEIRKI